MSIGKCKGIREHKSSMYNKHASMQDFSSHASGIKGMVMKKIISPKRKISRKVIKRTAGLLWGRNVGIRVFSGSAATQVASSHKLLVIHSPPRPKVILIANKAFMERQIGAYCILCREGGEQEGKVDRKVGYTEGWNWGVVQNLKNIEQKQTMRINIPAWKIKIRNIGDT